jgi:hypothetical protein
MGFFFSAWHMAQSSPPVATGAMKVAWFADVTL